MLHSGPWILRILVCSCLLSMGVVCAQTAAPPAVKPFPLNRVRQFYYRQAEQLLSGKQPIPDILPQFPGLDGGGFGHWGQNPEEVNFDHTLNSVNTGNVVCHVVNHFGKSTNKGVAVRVADRPAHSWLFDPEQLTFVDAWQGGFVRWGVSRFGVIGGVSADGQQWLNLTAGRWQLPEQTPIRYRGFYRHGADVLFSYQLGSASVLDTVRRRGDISVRTLRITGALPPHVRLTLLQTDAAAPSSEQANTPQRIQTVCGGQPAQVLLLQPPANCALQQANDRIELQFGEAEDDQPQQIHLAFSAATADTAAIEAAFLQADLSSMTAGTTGQWTQQTVITQGQPGHADKGFALDTLTVPYAQFNPFGTPMRLAGVGSFSDGRMAVSEIMGDVWLVDGIDAELREVKWQRIAAGLYQPLGLVIQNEQVLVLGRDQITRLHDLNNDQEADFYECVTNQYPTTGGHDFCTSLQADLQGRLYWFTASQNFGVTRYQPPALPESLGTGLRNSNGIGVSRDGSIVLATVQEGTWTPASAIFEVGGGSYHGLNGPREGHGPYGYDLPLCFLPRGVDNSSGEICFLPEDARLGPLSGAIVGTSFGNCSHYLILREQTEHRAQGGIVPLPGEFLSGACRLNFNQHDGCLYVAGTEGWQSYARENGSLQRLRYTGQPLQLPTRVETRSNGLLVHFNCEIQPESVRPENVFCQQWNYLYSAAYGSPEFSVKEPGRQAHDHVPVRSVHLLPDRRSVFVEIPELHPVMQFHLHLRLQAADGQQFVPDIYYSIFELGLPFTEFPGYQLIAKRRFPEFPSPEKYEQDPRLVRQEELGTNFGWVQEAVKLQVQALPGLQYEPRRLRVAPGRKVALAFHNTDPSMPHNIVIVKADQLEAFGEQSMLLASNPRSIATHYVPDDPAEICFSPILNSGDQYTVYFEAPREPGEYRMVCTYPGHWRVMRGSLFVLPDDQPLPPTTDDETSRRFVRQWTLDDLADEADQLHGRSFEHGKAVFSQAGCVKCHRIKDDGSQLGPELTRISDRFRGTRLLQHVLEPSMEINKQYQTWVAVTTEGRTIAGLLVDQTAESVTLLPNPLQPQDRVTLARNELEELVASTQSTMPTGLLMVFEKHEILDLLAYIQSGGESTHRVFRP